MKKIEAQEYEERQKQIKEQSQNLEIINPLNNYDDIK